MDLEKFLRLLVIMFILFDGVFSVDVEPVLSHIFILLNHVIFVSFKTFEKEIRFPLLMGVHVTDHPKMTGVKRMEDDVFGLFVSLEKLSCHLDCLSLFF